LAFPRIQVCGFPQWIELAAIRRAVSDIHDFHRIHHGSSLAMEQWQLVHRDALSCRAEYNGGELYARQLVGFRRADRPADLPDRSRDIRADRLRNRADIANVVSRISRDSAI